MKKKLKTFRVPIFLDEYFVHVAIGSIQDVLAAAKRYYGEDFAEFGLDGSKTTGWRGRTYHGFDKHPYIIVNGDLPYHVAVGTLAHEAVHAVEWIQGYVSINDANGEFLSHSVGQIVRTCIKGLLPKK